ncbi:MAG: DUF1273 domain-containing protein [Oscillospiraceae bacterium]|nr:DUF1273 domain-containing protein [Oscillospiraceae bacterium]
MAKKQTHTIFETACFTGYRPEKLPWGDDELSGDAQKLKQRLADVCALLYDGGIRRYLCGMARGADTYFVEELLKLKEHCPDISIEAAIPCPQQSERWTTEDRERYLALLRQCDEITVVSKEYTKWCMLERNKYMVNLSSVLVAVYDGKPGGTKFTRDYAEKRSLEIIDILL